ncbi:MAG TPA: hypothetical protein VK154_06235 [Chitinophagales bacterium]|nr:hypothetical protein [Chitinophagales bacterium]
MIKEMAKIFLVAALLITISSCDRQSCNDVVCANGTNCYQGNCYCPDGYEGTDCLTRSADKYYNLNNFASENCNGAPPFNTNLVSITSSGGNANELVITGLMGGYCSSVTAFIRTDTNNEGNIIEINEQSCGGSSVYGQGTYDKANRRVTFQLYYNFSGQTYQCSTIVQ